MARHLFQKPFAAGKQRHQHAPAVLASARSPHVPMRFQAIDQFHSAVMLQRQSFRERANSGFFAFRQAAKRQPSGCRTLNSEDQLPVCRASVTATHPHDAQAFTQGLEYYRGFLYESTGIAGRSSLRKVALQTGRVLKKVTLPARYFGEGLTIFRGKIYQLTWTSKVGFIYELNTFRQIGEFHYEFEGWGMTHDENSLIVSDGTNKIRYLDPFSFAVSRSIEVYAGKEAVVNLNELEYVKGQIFANIWHSPRIACIDPQSG